MVNEIDHYTTYISITYGCIVRIQGKIDIYTCFTIKHPGQLVYSEHIQETRYLYGDLFIEKDLGILCKYSKAAMLLFAGGKSAIGT